MLVGSLLALPVAAQSTGTPDLSKVAFTLATLVVEETELGIAFERFCLSERVAQGSFEPVEDLVHPRPICFLAFGEVAFDIPPAPLCALLDRVLDTGTESLVSSGVPCGRDLRPDLLRNSLEICVVERRLQKLLRTLFTHGLPAREPRACQEHLLMKAQAGATDQNESGHRDGVRLLEPRDDRGGYPLQRAVTAPQR